MSGADLLTGPVPLFTVAPTDPIWALVCPPGSAVVINNSYVSGF